jgi:hypothetical protein
LTVTSSRRPVDTASVPWAEEDEDVAGDDDEAGDVADDVPGVPGAGTEAREDAPAAVVPPGPAGDRNATGEVEAPGPWPLAPGPPRADDGPVPPDAA